MTKFPELSEKLARRIDRMMVDLARMDRLAALEESFIRTSTQVLSADCIAWNNWSLDWSRFLSGCLNQPYHKRFEALLDAFAEFVPQHPILAAGKFWISTTEVMQISDFQSNRDFRNNPLYREVYRHLDSEHQLSYAPVALTDRRVLLTINRSGSDFNQRDLQSAKYLGLRLAEVARWVERKQHLQSNWNQLIEFIGTKSQLNSLAELSARDVQLLEGLIRHGNITRIAEMDGIRRDTLDKRLGAIRERLRLDHYRQLLSAIAELRLEPVIQS